MKVNQVIAIVAAMFVVISGCGIAYTQSSNIYSTVFEVVEINESEDIIYLVDVNGNEWIWEGAKDWEVGDFAAATMSTNETDNIYDDTIIDLKYTRIAER